MTTLKFRLAGIATAMALLAAPLSSAQISPFSEDFESMDMESSTALDFAGWLVFGNVSDPAGVGVPYGYGPFPAPNGSGAFSNVAAGEGGAEQGAQQLVTFSDYNNGDHANLYDIEALIFQERVISAADAGTWIFKFDAKVGDIGGASTAQAFVKTLDPNAGFFTTSVATIDTTSLPATWATYTLAVNIDASQAGQLLQFGFSNVATNFEPSGVFYDNIELDRVSGVDAQYAQDFEALDAESGTALDFDGWLVFGNVSDPAGVGVPYSYGPFPAPNGSGAFSNVAVGEGGPEQGAQQLVTFSDYNNGDHANLYDIEALVFQERVISAADVGTRVFQFDAKQGDLAGASTAQAFLKTLDPNAGFFTTSSATIDTTSLPATWGTYTLGVNIDASQVGQIVQFGFSNVATNFEPSGVFYDNVVFGTLADPGPDTDGDGVADDVDNCTLVANADQRDSNGDGFGNICDQDLNNDGIVNPVDLGIFRTRFFSTDADADFDGNGVVNASDLGYLRIGFFQPPGPAGPIN